MAVETDKIKHEQEHGKHGHVHGPGCSHHHDITPYVRTQPKVGRNDPCPCGSGQKFKKCCEKSARHQSSGPV